MTRHVKILEQRYPFTECFKIEEAVLCYERFDGRLSEPVRRLTFDRGDSVAAILVRLPKCTFFSWIGLR